MRVDQQVSSPASESFKEREEVPTRTLLVVKHWLLNPLSHGTLGRSLFHVPGTPADARTAFVHGGTETLPVSVVRGQPHPLRQVLILF